MNDFDKKKKELLSFFQFLSMLSNLPKNHLFGKRQRLMLVTIDLASRYPFEWFTKAAIDPLKISTWASENPRWPPNVSKQSCVNQVTQEQHIFIYSLVNKGWSVFTEISSNFLLCHV